MEIQLKADEVTQIVSAVEGIGKTGITVKSLLTAINLQMNKKTIQPLYDGIKVISEPSVEYIEYVRKYQGLQRTHVDNHAMLRSKLSELNKSSSTIIAAEEKRIDRVNNEFKKSFKVDLIPIPFSDFEGTTAEAAAFICAISPMLIMDEKKPAPAQPKGR